MSYRIVLREAPNSGPRKPGEFEIPLPACLHYHDYYLELIGRTISRPLISQESAVIKALQNAFPSMNPEQQRIASEYIGMGEMLIAKTGGLGAKCEDYDRSPDRTRHHEKCLYIDFTHLALFQESQDAPGLVDSDTPIQRGVEISSFEPDVWVGLDNPSGVYAVERTLLRVWRARVNSRDGCVERSWDPVSGVKPDTVHWSGSIEQSRAACTAVKTLVRDAAAVLGILEALQPPKWPRDVFLSKVKSGIRIAVTELVSNRKPRGRERARKKSFNRNDVVRLIPDLDINAYYAMTNAYPGTAEELEQFWNEEFLAALAVTNHH